MDGSNLGYQITQIKRIKSSLFVWEHFFSIFTTKTKLGGRVSFQMCQFVHGIFSLTYLKMWLKNFNTFSFD